MITSRAPSSSRYMKDFHSMQMDECQLSHPPSSFMTEGIVPQNTPMQHNPCNGLVTVKSEPGLELGQSSPLSEFPRNPQDEGKGPATAEPVLDRQPKRRFQSVGGTSRLLKLAAEEPAKTARIDLETASPRSAVHPATSPLQRATRMQTRSNRPSTESSTGGREQMVVKSGKLPSEGVCAPAIKQEDEGLSPSFNYT